MRRRRPPGEPVEDHGAFLLGHTDPVVVDGDLHPFAGADRRELNPRRAAVFDGVGDRVVHGQPQTGRQPDDDDRGSRDQRHVQIGIDAHRVVGGAVEQLGDVHRHVVVGGGQLALRQPLQCAEGGLDAGLGADDVADHFLALFFAQVERREHLEVGAHRGQRGAQFVRRHRGEVPRGSQRRLGAALFFPDALQRAFERVGDLDGLGGAADVDVGGLVAGVDLACLLGQSLERADRERRQQPAAERAGGHR